MGSDSINSSIVSYGIACVRKNDQSGNYEILMIKKKNTYHFIDFVWGKYDISKTQDLEHMFEGMTINEKSMIRTMNFDVIWEYCNHINPNRTIYNRGNRKFKQLLDKGEAHLLKLISNTKVSNLFWEIPKGRLNKKELPLNAAIREFKEETNISKNQYRILFDEGVIEYVFVDCGIRYKYIYYIAILESNVNPKYIFINDNMMNELSDISFMSSNAIQQFNNKRLAKIARVIIKKSKKYFA